jgi:dolichyl-phosphate beta-glucosyltransferase
LTFRDLNRHKVPIPVLESLRVAPEPPIHLSLVIPAHCEEKRLPVTLPRIRSYFDAQPHTWEIILVDDGSSDRTSEVAAELLQGMEHTILRNEPNAGKGASIRRGMLASRGAYALFSDADLSTPIEMIEKFWPEVERGADVVFGSRALPESDLAIRQPLHREMMGRTFNLFVRMIVLPGVRDSQCGFKMFSRQAVERIFPLQRMDGFSFDVEILRLAREWEFQLAEVPVRWEDSPDSRVHPIRDSAAMLRDLFRVRRQIRRLRRTGTFDRSERSEP